MWHEWGSRGLRRGGAVRVLRHVAFVVVVLVFAVVGAVALYWFVTEVHSLADYVACYIELILGGVCIAPVPDVL